MKAGSFKGEKLLLKGADELARDFAFSFLLLLISVVFKVLSHFLVVVSYSPAYNAINQSRNLLFTSQCDIFEGPIERESINQRMSESWVFNEALKLIFVLVKGSEKRILAQDIVSELLIVMNLLEEESNSIAEGPKQANGPKTKEKNSKTVSMKFKMRLVSRTKKNGASKGS